MRGRAGGSAPPRHRAGAARPECRRGSPRRSPCPRACSRCGRASRSPAGLRAAGPGSGRSAKGSARPRVPGSRPAR